MSPRMLLTGLVALAAGSCGQPAPEASHPVQMAAPEPDGDAEPEEEPSESAFAPSGATAGFSSARSSNSGTEALATSEKVRFELYIMSKCPFANKVLQALSPVLKELRDNVDLEVGFIGREKDGELTSMHGEPEVKGDILYLCAAEHGSQHQWMGFVDCITANWRKIPEGWERCAERADLDTSEMWRCYNGEQGRQLLRTSFILSKNRNATGSPTIFLAGEPYRGGRSETSFARAICAEFQGPKPSYCEQLPAPVRVPVAVVADARCTGRGCDPERFLAFIVHMFEGAEIEEYDYADAEGKRLFDLSGEQYLPIAVFGPEVEREEAGYKRLKRRLKRIQGSDDLVYPLGRNWDPTAEICDDGIDNTGNGKVDCRDVSCKGKKVCRKEIPGKLQLFTMGMCPYCNQLLVVIPAVLERFGKNRERIDFSLEFIGTNDAGQLSSMRGGAEVAEDMRQACAQKHYPKRYKFMEYVSCRAAAMRKSGNAEKQNAWKKCAKKGIKAAVIETCADGREGKKLLEASFARAAQLEITASPTWLLNNKHDMQGRTEDAIVEAFCAKNQKRKGCR